SISGVDARDRERALVELVRLVELLGCSEPLLRSGSAAERDHHLNQQMVRGLLDPTAAVAGDKTVVLQGGLCPRRIGRAQKADVVIDAEWACQGRALGVLLEVGRGR